MLKKCFIILQFGSKHEWMDQFIETVAKLEQYGWSFMIFTPNEYGKVPNNFLVKSMTIDEFNCLVEKQTGVKPTAFITEGGIPSIHVTEFMVAYGKIFEDYLSEFDFWGMMGGPDIVFGRLDHFIPDSLLEICDVFTDDVATINGCFSLFRNNEETNTLFQKIPNWKEAFITPACPRCTGAGSEHTLVGTDEYGMTEVMKMSPLRYHYPPYYPLLSHDRLEQHVPTPKLEIKPDGSLWELFADTSSPTWIHARPFIGREIPYFHFSATKRWPL